MKTKDSKATILANHILHHVLDIDRIWNGMKQADKTPGRTKKYEHLKKKYGKNLAEYAAKLDDKGVVELDNTHYFDPTNLLELTEIKLADQGKQTKVIKLYCKKLLAQYVQDVRAMTKDIGSEDGDSWTFYPIYAQRVNRVRLTLDLHKRSGLIKGYTFQPSFLTVSLHSGKRLKVTEPNADFMLFIKTQEDDDILTSEIWDFVEQKHAVKDSAPENAIFWFDYLENEWRYQLKKKPNGAGDGDDPQGGNGGGQGGNTGGGSQGPRGNNNNKPNKRGGNQSRGNQRQTRSLTKTNNNIIEGASKRRGDTMSDSDEPIEKCSKAGENL